MEKFSLNQISIISMIIIGVVLHSPFGVVTGIEINFWGTKEQDAKYIEGLYRLSGHESVLYLDPGDGPYYFKANSSCRYICSLPVQRNTQKWNLANEAAYIDNYNCILSYKGKYIVSVDSWIDPPAHPELLKKIRTEYTLIYNKSWDIYERNI